MNDERDNVIHVSFGPGGGRRAAEPTPPAPSEVEPPEQDRGEPVTDLYSTKEVARLFGVSEGKLRYWAKSGFLGPSAQVGRRRFYTFQDLIGLRTAKGLMDRGVPLQEVRKSLDALRTTLPRVIRPLAELRVVADGTTLVVQDEAGSFEPSTGQLVLDFRVDALRQDVVRVLRGRDASLQDRRSAYEWYLEGCRLDEDETTYADAEHAYRMAVRLDPTLANALTNLGNLRYRQGDFEGAESLYEQALTIDGTQPEAFYNLGFLYLERGELAQACAQLEQALAHDPSFADAHFNLALALEELGQKERARPHWETYLRLEPSGPWAEVAQRHLR